MQNGTDPRERKDPKQPKQEKVRVRFRPARFFLTFFLLAAVVAGAFLLLHKIDAQKGGEEPGAASEPPVVYETGYLRSDGAMIPVYEMRENEAGQLLRKQAGEFARGTAVEYEQGASVDEEGYLNVRIDGAERLVEEDRIVRDAQDVLEEKTLYMHTTQNLIADLATCAPGALIAKGTELSVIGYDELDETGAVHRYLVETESESGETITGYVRPWYLSKTAEEALATYEPDTIGAIHAARSDRYGGGDGGSLDYTPRQKGAFSDNVMPEECRTLYLCGYRAVIADVDSYIALADSCGINAFVVDISDGSAIGYASPYMQEHSPTCFAAAQSTVEEYGAAIQKIKDAGYYVIGRITTFNDTGLVTDHPEFGILDQNGAPLKMQGNFWPSAYSRGTWQYKLGLAKEAVELFGFNEIQFDYVRFPDGTYSYEKNGTINYQNVFGETKAQAIQRFLMYVCDELHDEGVYVSADVFGETSNDYVAAYGQYWPAISNVVDVISAMPYPDHYGESGGYKPWEHPYETLSVWAAGAVARQAETPTPAGVRTWIQAYDAIRPPYPTYGPDQVGAQIRAIRDAGITGGYMTWNGSSNIYKYRSLVPAFNL